MSYKKSVFNYYLDQGKELVIYNTLNESLIKVPDYKTQAYNDAWLQKLLCFGMIVTQENDEKKRGIFKYYKNVYSNNLNLIILTTGQCNFRCKYCYETFEKGNLSEETTQGLIRYLQRNITKYASVHIDWFGGEPLVNMTAIREISPKVIELCGKAKIPFSAGITTNGSLMTKDIFEELLAYHVYSVQVTVDGVKNNHDKYRVFAGDRGSSFDVIMQNLINIRDLDRIQKYPYKISIRSNVTKEGLATLEEYIQFMSLHFQGNSHFDFFFRPVGDWGGDKVVHIKDSLLSDLETLYGILLKHVPDIDYSPFLALLKQNLCYAARYNNYVIDPTGKICKCTVDFDNPINCIGKLTPEGRMDIDEGLLAQWIAWESADEKCKNCFASCKCLNGTCPLVRIKGNQIACGYEIKQLKFTLELIVKTLEEKGYDLKNGYKM